MDYSIILTLAGTRSDQFVVNLLWIQRPTEYPFRPHSHQSSLSPTVDFIYTLISQPAPTTSILPDLFSWVRSSRKMPLLVAYSMPWKPVWCPRPCVLSTLRSDFDAEHPDWTAHFD